MIFWVYAAYIQPTLHVHLRYTKGALQFDLEYHYYVNAIL